MRDDSPPPWQSKPTLSGKYGCLFVGIGLPALVLVLLVGTYMIWTARANRQAAAALDAIRAAGEPVDGDELDAYYSLPEEADDVTQLWLAAMEPLEGPDYDQACEPLPIVGNQQDEQPIPPPGEPWKDLDAVEAFLDEYSDAISVAHEAAERAGAARYPVDFSQGWGALLEHVDQARPLARVLSLEARVRAHRGDWSGAVRSLRHIHRLAGSLEREPCLVSQLVRQALDGIAREALQNFMEAEDYPIDELAGEQQTLQSIDYSEGLRRAMVGERAVGLSIFDDPAMLDDAMRKAPLKLAFSLVPRGDDVAMYVSFMNRTVAATELKPPERLAEFEAIENDLGDTLGGLGPVGKIRYMVSAMALPAVSAAARAEARNTASNRAAAAVIAAERFRAVHGRLPEKLDELAPDFLSEVPADPFTGDSMKVKSEDDKITVYSVGENRTDDQGGNDYYDGDRDDVAFPRPPEPEE